MSLSSMIANAVRPRVPEAVLQQCLEGDRVVVENIAMVALEFVPALNLPLASMAPHKNGRSYELHMPITVERCRLSLADLRSIQAHAPARVGDVALVFEDGACHLSVSICNEKHLVHFSEIDIIRMHKRAR